MASLRSAQEPVGGGVYNPRLYAFDQIAKVRYAYGSLAALAEAAADGSTVDMVRIPQGRVRVLPFLSRVWTSAYGSSRVMDFGFRAYYGSDGKTVVAEAANQMKNDLDVSGALAAAVIDTASHIDFYSQGSVDDKQKGPMLFVTVAGGTIPIGGTLEIMLAYMQN